MDLRPAERARVTGDEGKTRSTVEFDESTSMVGVVIVDDEPAARLLVRRQLESSERVHVVGEASGAEEALEVVGAMEPDVVLVDIRMPRIDGIEATRMLKERHVGIRVIALTTFGDADTVRRAVEAGVDGYVVKGEGAQEIVRAVAEATPGRPFLSRRATLSVLDRLVARPGSGNGEGILSSAAHALHAVMGVRDPTTGEHAERALSLSTELAGKVDAALAEDQTVRLGYLLHDIGKIGVPDAVLMKPGPLTAAERLLVEQHPLHGVRILERAGLFAHGHLVPIVRHHHERWDGSGYPDGLEKDRIPLACRVFAVVDAFDAMTSHRPYRDAMPLNWAVNELKANASTQFDPDAVEAFLELIDADA